MRVDNIRLKSNVEPIRQHTVRKTNRRTESGLLAVHLVGGSRKPDWCVELQP